MPDHNCDPGASMVRFALDDGYTIEIPAWVEELMANAEVETLASAVMENTREGTITISGTYGSPESLGILDEIDEALQCQLDGCRAASVGGDFCGPNHQRRWHAQFAEPLDPHSNDAALVLPGYDEARWTPEDERDQINREVYNRLAGTWAVEGSTAELPIVDISVDHGQTWTEVGETWRENYQQRVISSDPALEDWMIPINIGVVRQDGQITMETIRRAFQLSPVEGYDDDHSDH